MSDIVYPNLEEMARRLPGDVFKVFSGFEKALADAMFVRAKAGLAKRVPVATGFLYSTLTEDKQNQRYSVGFTDPKANALDIGRKKSKPFHRQVRSGAAQRGRRGRLLGAHGTGEIVRMLGSKQPQARRGMTRSTGFSLRAMWPQILEEAAQKAGGSEPE
jgi:hypothetical protein